MSYSPEQVDEMFQQQALPGVRAIVGESWKSNDTKVVAALFSQKSVGMGSGCFPSWMSPPIVILSECEESHTMGTEILRWRSE